MALPFDPANEIGVVLCMLVEHVPVPAPGSTQRKCDGCKRPIWIADPARTVADMHELPTMCGDCASKFILNEGKEGESQT